jgi:predicted peptidase
MRRELNMRCMRFRIILKLLLVIVLFQTCTEKEKVQPKKPIAPPTWTAEFPSLRPGAVSVDLSIKTDKPALVYWVITSDQRSFTAEDLKALSARSSVNSETFSGETITNGHDVVLTTAENLKENTAYTLYFIAQNSSTDSTYQSSVTSIDFKTKIRQDTLQYQSVAENRTVDYLMYRTEDALKNPEKKYPIVFFLSGYGQVGTPRKPIAMIDNGSLTEYIYKGNDVPMMVMSIQHVKEVWNNDLINEGIDHAIATHPVDQDKMYLIGMSGGAFGCWDFAVEHPERLAAIVPISGVGNNDKACQLKNLSIWAFCNKVDEVVHPGRTTTMIEDVLACNPSKEVKLEVFPDKGHNAWKRVFDPKHEDWKKSPNAPRVNIYDWLLSKSLTTN